MRQTRPADKQAKTFTVMHASTVPLPGNRADYGAGVVHKLSDGDVFVSLMEFGDEAVGSALFPVVDEIPRVDARSFHPNQLQRRIRGQGGLQTFFTYNGRAFCLYVVLGSHARRIQLAARVNQLISQLSIEPPA